MLNTTILDTTEPLPLHRRLLSNELFLVFERVVVICDDDVCMCVIYLGVWGA